MIVISGDTVSTGSLPPYLAACDGLVMLGAPQPTAITLVPGTLIRGAVLGQITASGWYALCDASQSDGRQTPVAILASPANAITGASATAYLPQPNTTFDGNYLLHAPSWSDQAMAAALQAAGFTLLTRGFSTI